MSKPKKMSALNKAKATVKQQALLIQKLDTEVGSLKASLSLAETQLTEARRRTLPIGNSEGAAGEMSFLPVYVTEVKIERPVYSFASERGGFQKHVAGLATATIICQGQPVYYPPVKKG